MLASGGGGAVSIRARISGRHAAIHRGDDEIRDPKISRREELRDRGSLRHQRLLACLLAGPDDHRDAALLELDLHLDLTE